MEKNINEALQDSVL